MGTTIKFLREYKKLRSIKYGEILDLDLCVFFGNAQITKTKYIKKEKGF